MRAILLILPLLALSCASSPQPSPQEVQHQVDRALDLTHCAASDVLPGIAETVNTILDRDTDTIRKILAGVLGAGGALARAYGCYLRDRATVRTQDDSVPAGEVRTWAADTDLIAARADACGERQCPRPEHAAARLLMDLQRRGKVVLSRASPR